MNQCNMGDLEDIENDVLNELSLNTLDGGMSPTRAHEGENHNKTVDEDTELSDHMRA